MTGRLLSGLLAVVLSTTAAMGQSPNWADLPPGSTGYFGSSLNDKFTPQALFPTPPPAVTTPPPPSSSSSPNAPTPIPLGTTTLKPEDVLFPPKSDAAASPPPPDPKIWFGSFDFGINGASGNSNVTNIRTTANIQRKTPTNLFVNDLVYVYAHQDGETQQDQALWNVRDEILLPGSPWSLFSATQVEYDELRTYRFRVGVYTGAGYTIVDTKPMVFRVRAGAGAQRQLGVDGAQNQWVPEAVFGYDFKCRIDDRNAFVSILDYYPRLDDWGQYRVRTRLAYEHVLDPKTGAILRIGIQDRYDTNSGESKRNDVNYFTTLGFKF